MSDVIHESPLKVLLLQNPIFLIYENDVICRRPLITIIAFFSNRTCNGHTCYFSKNRNFLEHPMTKNIFFLGTKFSIQDLPLPRQQRHDWSLFHDREPSSNPLLSHSAILELFNHTATFSSFSGTKLILQQIRTELFQSLSCLIKVYNFISSPFLFTYCDLFSKVLGPKIKAMRNRFFYAIPSYA